MLGSAPGGLRTRPRERGRGRTVAAAGLGPDRSAGSERSAGVRGVSACCPERELRHAGACARGGAPREARTARGQGKEEG